MKILIYWFRQDLRLQDNPALLKACQSATHLVPVYIHDSVNNADTAWGFKRTSTHRIEFLSSALKGLHSSLSRAGNQLLELHGDSATVLKQLADTVGINEIHCESIAAPEEQEVVRRLRASGLQVCETWQSTMLEISELPFMVDRLPEVFTQFRNRIEAAGIAPRVPFSQPVRIPPSPTLPSALPSSLPSSLPDSLLSSVPSLAPTPSQASWTKDEKAIDARASSFPYRKPEFFGSEQAAHAHLAKYFAGSLASTYKTTRNELTGVNFSTKFSPWLALGAISAPQIMQALRTYETSQGANASTYWIWFELLWRDYFRVLHLKYGRTLYHEHGLSVQANPSLSMRQTDSQHHAERLEQWCTGHTGQPLIDAAMRELHLTGYLSNRLRQVVASYLIYDLKLDWRAGAAWFESQLIDYDTYSNQGNWLYIAGLGTDPRGGRRFNIEKQTQDHDPQGHYRTRWGCT